MARAIPYMAAVQWLVDNDDTSFIHDGEHPPLSVSASLVADIYGKTDSEVLAALRRVEPTPRIRGIGYVDPVRHDG